MQNGPATPSDAPQQVKPGWMTIVGGIIVAVTPVVEQVVPGFTEATQAIFQAIGGIVGVIGLRRAISKNGYGV